MTGPLRNTEDQAGRPQDRREAVPNALLRAARHRRGWTRQALAELADLYRLQGNSGEAETFLLRAGRTQRREYV